MLAGFQIYISVPVPWTFVGGKGEILYIRIHLKIIPWKFCILSHNKSWVIYLQSLLFC